jgi:hypothetical protein
VRQKGNAGPNARVALGVVALRLSRFASAFDQWRHETVPQSVPVRI